MPLTIIRINDSMPSMYICVCKAVSDKRIAREVEGGVTTLKELRDRTELGTGCGKCVPTAYRLLRDALDAGRSPAAHHELATRTA